jgi:SnoaL-like polyketide cyclase/PDZ domain
MSESNVKIVREYIEVLNHNQFDRIFEFCSEECILHGGPYVGIGVAPDDSSGEKIILQTILPNGPAAGFLQPGDELVRAADADEVWETFKELKSGLWGHGVAGTTVTITVRRDGKLLEFHLKRGFIEDAALKLSERINAIRSWSKTWPDLKEEINLIFGAEDLVAVFSTLNGTNQDYHRSAVWSGCSIYRLEDGRIVEIMGVEDEYTQMKQLGYLIREPQPEITV